MRDLPDALDDPDAVAAKVKRAKVLHDGELLGRALGHGLEARAANRHFEGIVDRGRKLFARRLLCRGRLFKLDAKAAVKPYVNGGQTMRGRSGILKDAFNRLGDAGKPRRVHFGEARLVHFKDERHIPAGGLCGHREKARRLLEGLECGNVKRNAGVRIAVGIGLDAGKAQKAIVGIGRRAVNVGRLFLPKRTRRENVLKGRTLCNLLEGMLQNGVVGIKRKAAAKNIKPLLDIPEACAEHAEKDMKLSARIRRAEACDGAAERFGRIPGEKSGRTGELAPAARFRTGLRLLANDVKVHSGAKECAVVVGSEKRLGEPHRHVDVCPGFGFRKAAVFNALSNKLVHKIRNSLGIRTRIAQGINAGKLRSGQDHPMPPSYS